MRHFCSSSSPAKQEMLSAAHEASTTRDLRQRSHYRLLWALTDKKVTNGRKASSSRRRRRGDPGRTRAGSIPAPAEGRAGWCRLNTRLTDKKHILFARHEADMIEAHFRTADTYMSACDASVWVQL